MKPEKIHQPTTNDFKQNKRHLFSRLKWTFIKFLFQKNKVAHDLDIIVFRWPFHQWFVQKFEKHFYTFFFRLIAKLFFLVFCFADLIVDIIKNPEGEKVSFQKLEEYILLSFSHGLVKGNISSKDNKNLTSSSDWSLFRWFFNDKFQAKDI